MPWARANFTSTTRTIPAAVTKKEKRKKTREGALSAQREPFSTICGIIIVVVIFELFCLLYISIFYLFHYTSRDTRVFLFFFFAFVFFFFCWFLCCRRGKKTNERERKKNQKKKKRKETGFYPRFWIKIDPHRAKTPHTRKDIDANVKPHRRR